LSMRSPLRRARVPLFAALAATLYGALALDAQERQQLRQSQAPAPTTTQQQRVFEPPPNVEMREVVIWSDGYRLDGDVFSPKGLADGEKLPGILLSHGWGGTKTSSRRTAAKFAAAGYVALGFSYRTWGKSEGPMILVDGMPQLGESNEATVKVRFVREVVDPLAWASDFQHALDFLVGEPHVHPGRIGIWGTSYGGGMVIWSAAHDDRPKAVVSQVGGMGVAWPEMAAVAEKRQTDIARGDMEPIPQAIDRTGELRGTPNFAHMIRYDAVAVAHRVKVPTLLIDAENEELFDRRDHGGRVFEILRTHGNAPVRQVVMPGITHYGIYREGFEESTDLALEWFDLHLKGKRRMAAAQ
ncbi:MAG TPA: CocE/NonD family hydrolase, partial [Thermoanaerobaculia bacterium]|nr:CocE/NonD family hydrolase [Thermoanaerobaculia bacterium]